MTSALELSLRLCTQAGFDPQVVTEAHVHSALRRRQQATGATSADAYAETLDREPAEQQALLEELLVRETWFYRDHTPFELVAELAGSRWQHGARPVRALSAPCASGEEAYSIAIALATGGVAPGRIAVDAIDLSQRSLATAAAAVYAERALAKLPTPLRARWLRPVGEDRWCVDAELRQTVTLSHANLLALPPSPDGAGYDIVFCRNALIYLEPQARAKVLDELTARLAPDGVLVVGHAETGLLRGRPLRPMGKPGTFAFAPSAAGPAAIRTADKGVGHPVAARPLQRKRVTTVTAAKPPARSASQAMQLEQARALADRGAYTQAAAQVDIVLGQQPDNADAQHLLGLIRAAEGRTTEARQCFQRALYLAPAHLPSLQHLALLAERCGDATQARLLQQRVARLESGL